MNISSIASTSVYTNQSQLQQIVSIAIAKKAMDGQEAASSQLIETLKEVAPAPPSTSKLDISV